MAEFVKVAKTTDIPEGQMKGFEVGFDNIVIAHTSEGFFALADECSHDSAPIHEGRVRNGNMVCPRHGAKFDIKTGTVTGPPAVVAIDSYDVKIDGEDIYVKIDD